MHHKNSIISNFLMGGFLALSLAACESPQPPYPNGSTTTTMTGTTGTTVTGSTSTTTTTAPTTTGQQCETHQVIMNNFQFMEPSVTIKPCDTVNWVHQQGQVEHTVTSGSLGAGNAGAQFDSRGGDPNARMTEAGTSSFSHTFNSAGTFPYHCVVHGAPNGGGMSGTITVNP